MNHARPHDGLFRVLDDDDSTLLPSPLTGGPWNPSHQHGGSVAGILTRAMLQTESPVPMRLARITVEMFRGVPTSELRIEKRVLRAGRRIQSVEANLFDDKIQVARATGLRIRREDSLASVATHEPMDPDLGQPDAAVPPRPQIEGFGNPDLSIHILREPRTDWIGIRGRSRRAADGIGQSAATLYDLEGPIATVQASLLLDRR